MLELIYVMVFYDIIIIFGYLLSRCIIILLKNLTRNKVKIPQSFSKNELYSIINLFIIHIVWIIISILHNAKCGAFFVLYFFVSLCCMIGCMYFLLSKNKIWKIKTILLMLVALFLSFWNWFFHFLWIAACV